MPKRSFHYVCCFFPTCHNPFRLCCNRYFCYFKWQCCFFKWLVSWLTMFQPQMTMFRL